MHIKNCILSKCKSLRTPKINQIIELTLSQTCIHFAEMFQNCYKQIKITLRIIINKIFNFN